MRILLSKGTSLTTALPADLLLQLPRVRRSLDSRSAVSLHAFVSSRIDYCNTLLLSHRKLLTSCNGYSKPPPCHHRNTKIRPWTGSTSVRITEGPFDNMCTDRSSTSLDEGRSVRALFVDYAKAFDHVDHGFTACCESCVHMVSLTAS